MIILTLGYFFLGFIFLILRLFYHILPKKSLHKNLFYAVKNDFINLYNYSKQIVLSNPKKIKFIVAVMICLIILPIIQIHIEIEFIIEDFLFVIMFFVLLIIFAPQENPADKGFPVEIFGFIYSIICMYYSSGCLVFDIFFAINSLKENMYMYGYSITVISYVICIATLSRFMERELSKQEIILLGMIMLTTLEFLTYYGIGFFGGVKWIDYDPVSYEFSILNMFGDITTIIIQGIFIASL